MNTEFYTLWFFFNFYIDVFYFFFIKRNYRRQIFQKIEKEMYFFFIILFNIYLKRPKEEMKIIYENELKFIEKSIASC